jgi:hypothetical protein
MLPDDALFKSEHNNSAPSENIQTPVWLRGPPTDWRTVLANGTPVRHYPPHRKDLAIQYATDPAFCALLVMFALGPRRRPPVGSASR